MVTKQLRRLVFRASAVWRNLQVRYWGLAIRVGPMIEAATGDKDITTSTYINVADISKNLVRSHPDSWVDGIITEHISAKEVYVW